MLSLSVFTLATFFAALHGYRNSQQQVDVLFDNDLVNIASFIANSQAQDLVAEPPLEVTVPAPTDLAQEALPSRVNVIDVDMLYQILQQNRVIQRSKTAPAEPIVSGEPGFKEVTFFAKRWRTYTKKISDDYAVVVAQPIDYRRESAESILLTTVAPVIYAMPIIGILLFYVIRKSLGPLVVLSLELKQKSSDDLSQIDISNPPKELQPVVGRLNTLLNRLSLAFERERTLSANAAHELRTPVSVLRLSAHNLRAAGDKGRLSQQQFDELDANVDRMAHVIEQIIALYRYSPEHFSEQMRPVSLDHLLREVVADNYTEIEQNGQDISLDAVPASIMGESFALQILFENVLKNAIKYSGRGSQIVISLAQQDDQVVATIEDSGHVEKDEITRLTQTFYRSRHVLETGIKGSGLGLSIVQYICHIHGGTLRLSQSSLGGLAVSVAFQPVPITSRSLDA
jgi:two-component system sensor histidine kinase QseC